MIRLQRLTLLVEVTNKLSRVGGGGWVDQVGLKLTQSPTGVGVGVGTELGNYADKTNVQRLWKKIYPS